MDGLVTAAAAVGGLVAGDQLEVVVERVGARVGFERPWHRCPKCERPAAVADSLPLVRVLARRHCPHCGGATPFATRPLLMGLVSALVLGAMATRFGTDVALAPFCVLGLALVAISAVDIERYMIPNRIVYPTLVALIPLLVLSSALDHRWGSLARAAIAGAVAFAGFFAVHLAVPKGMGFGDVRLSGVIGVATGWLGLGHAFVAFFAAFVLGAVIGIGVMAVTHGGRKTRIPFGPFMAAGAVVAVLWGNPLAHALFHRGA
ncbi:MAG TPA: A24 family peptidase [Acidimicrobiales bacterium]|nr:A24 family peptidase [Acidimicrobiales bacterium]